MQRLVRRPTPILILFGVILLFALFVIVYHRYYQAKTDHSLAVAEIVTQFKNGMQSYEGYNGLYGVLDEEGNVLFEAKWNDVILVNDDMLIVAKETGDSILIGGIDYQENILLPFVFSDFTYLGNDYYIAELSGEDTCILYDSDCDVIFQDYFETVSYDSGILHLYKEGCKFSYYMLQDSPLFRRATLQCTIGETSFSWLCTNQNELSVLSYSDLLTINRLVNRYTSMLFADDFTELDEITESEYQKALQENTYFANASIYTMEGYSFTAVDSEYGDYVFTLSLTLRIKQESYGYYYQKLDVLFYFQKGSSDQWILSYQEMDPRTEGEVSN